MVVSHNQDRYSMRNSENIIHPLKYKGPENVLRKRKIDVNDLELGTFIENNASIRQSTISTSIGQYQS